MSTKSAVIAIDPFTLDQWQRSGQAVLVDVRPVEMFLKEHVPGAMCMPLAILDKGALPDLGGRKLVFQCQVGISSEKAGQKILGQGLTCDVHHLGGGIVAWKGAGFAVEGRAPGGISIQRQVQLVAGSLVLAGAILGWTVSPWFLALPVFVGAGLAFSGATGTCGMAAMLARLPFNRRGVTG